MIPMRAFLFAPFLLAAPLLAQQAPAPAPDAQPKVEQISETEFRVGKITFNSETREIRFPTTLELTMQPIEYIVVLNIGRVHETLLLTDIEPENLNIAFKLLRYPASAELFTILRENMTSTGEFPDVAAEVKQGARIDIHLGWTADGAEKKFPLRDLVQHRETLESIRPGPWLYTGSSIHDGKFQASLQGDLIALKSNRAAIVNDPLQRPEEENLWQPFTKRLPEKGTPITVIISPFQAS